MAIVFRPALYNPAASDPKTVFCPRPVIDLDLPWEYALSRHKVPLANGEKTFGRSLNGLQITLTGQIGTVGDSTNGESQVFTEEDMMDAVVAFATHLTTGTHSTKYEFFTHYDDDLETYRKFKGVRPVSFVPRIGDSNPQLWQYTLVMVVEDPNVYTTAPGE